ncbi:hypothetical protein COT48_05605 [Candidatus Woesearchaeota archaeon CG08_land_8_20_14_0_20_47_9]|nr:MAG: hypothetical protein COT48_05605 [Candidatus Woesearchaeota archaeon CG08_land_8_20_14_0_20_47_9]HII30120.1 DUF89 family protein [Candidatus Woesearchaeota archaeon]
MKTRLECANCFTRQIENFVKLAGIDKTQAEIIESEMKKYVERRLKKGAWLPEDVNMFTTFWYRELYDLAGNPDPYREMKEQANEVALKIAGRISPKNLRERAMTAIVGNTIDFSACQGHEYDINEIVPTFERLSSEDFAICDIEELDLALRSANTVLYLPDNNGEIVFDCFLLEHINEFVPKERVFIAGKSSPLVSDVTVDELRQLGIDRYGKLISTGTNSFGINPYEVSDEFKELLRTADVIIAKGQAYYESISNYNFRNVFHLLRIKCPLLGESIGLPAGSNVLMSSERYAKQGMPYFDTGEGADEESSNNVNNVGRTLHVHANSNKAADTAIASGIDAELLTRLKGTAQELRREILTMITRAGSGHPGGSLSAIDIITALYFYKMRYKAEEPHWSERDRFVLSKGHACPALYAALARAGFFDQAALAHLRCPDSILSGHPDMNKTPGIDMTTGSLGMGLAAAVGMAIAGVIDKKDYHVYAMIGDGECQEGNIWEAAMAAAHYKLTRLRVFLDLNGLQIDGCTRDVMNIEPIADKWLAFGWRVLEVNGHDFRDIINALDEPDDREKPTIVIAHTVKGKGVSFMENVVDFHGKALTEEELDKALKELA